jgi:outer membrane protein OmpA-like peptidoglycan-associated protein
MTYIISHFWFWLLAIFVVGIATAILTRQVEERGKISPWLIWCGLAFALGFLMALLHVLAGRAGVWLESGLAAFAVFIVGAGAGALARKSDFAEHKGWALGLIPATLLWFAANVSGTPNVEANLKQSVAAAIKESGGNSQNFDVVGRDVLLPDNIADRALLVGTIGKVDGVRLVSGTDKTFVEAPVAATGAEALDAGKATAEKAADADKKAVATGWADPGKADHDAARKPVDAAKPTAEKAAEADKKPVATGWADPGRADYDAKAVANGKAVVDQTKTATIPAVGQAKPAMPAMSAAETATAAKAVLTALPNSGPLDAAACQEALNATQVLDKVQFHSRSLSIHLPSAYVLDRLAALLKRCPDQKVEIGVHTDNVGGDEDNRALSQRRADRVVQYLVNEGVAVARLSGVGYGAKRPIASNDAEDGRADNRRIEFILK